MRGFATAGNVMARPGVAFVTWRLTAGDEAAK
jgi:hypothetical protein